MAYQPALDPKTPEDEKDYGIDWTDQLAGATISDSQWDVPAGIDEEASNVDGSTAVIRLSGGTAGSNYTLTNTITTSTGEVLVNAIQIRVRTAERVAGL